MSLSRLLSAAFSLALLAACSTGGQPPTSALASPSNPVQSSAAPVPTPASIPPPLVIPRPTVPFVRCDTKELEMQLISVNGAASNVLAIVEVRNKSTHDCDLYGYAGLQLLDARGRPLSTRVSWSTDTYFGTAPAAAIVGLPAGTAAITPDHPVAGHAYIPIVWGDSAAQCAKPTQFKVTPPGAATSLVIAAFPPGAGPGEVWICLGGSVIINPTRAAMAPPS
jgi:hypothetical protein